MKGGHGRFIATLLSLGLYAAVFLLLPDVVAAAPFLRRFDWQYIFLLLLLSVLTLVDTFAGKNLSRYCLFLRGAFSALVAYTVGNHPIVPVLLVLSVVQGAAFRQSFAWTAGISGFSVLLALAAIVPNRLVFGVPVPGLDFRSLVSFSMIIVPTIVLSLALRAASESEERWRGTVDRLDLAVSRLAETNLGYQGYAQEVRGVSIAEERKRISREIHDSVGYSLTNIRVMLEAANLQMEKTPEETRRLIDQCMSEAGLCLDQTREAMRQLRSREVPQASGHSAIQRLVTAFSAVTGINVVAEYGNVPSRWPLPLEKAIYRLVQEGMTNAFRHGMATEIFIYLWYERPVLKLIVRDNGSGAGEIKEGIGITGMRERVENLGGRVEVGPRPDGFEVRAWVPIEDDKEENHAD